MSAFLCDPQHIGLLARHVEVNRSYHSGDSGTELAERWARANLKSLRERYPDHGEEGQTAPSWCSAYRDDEDFVRQCVLAVLASPVSHLTHIQAVKMAHCLEYQSCEFEGYYTSEAYYSLTRAVRTCIQAMDGYEEAMWEYQGAA